MIEKWECISIRKKGELWLIHHWKWQAIVFVHENVCRVPIDSSNLSHSSLNIISKIEKRVRFFCVFQIVTYLKISILPRSFFKTCHLILFYQSLKKLLTIKHFSLEMRLIRYSTFVGIYLTKEKKNQSRKKQVSTLVNFHISSVVYIRFYTTLKTLYQL